MKPQKELQRKVIHLGTVILPLILLQLGQGKGKLFLAILSGVAIIVEMLRLEWKPFKEVFDAMFGEMLKEKERHGLTGATAFIITALLCAMLFDWRILILSLLFLSIGDAFSTLVGRKLGKTKVFGTKTLEGFLAFLAGTIPIAFIFNILPLTVRLLGAVSAALFEVIDTPIDDNVVVLLGSNMVMQTLMFIT